MIIFNVFHLEDHAGVFWQAAFSTRELGQAWIDKLTCYKHIVYPGSARNAAPLEGCKTCVEYRQEYWVEEYTIDS